MITLYQGMFSVNAVKLRFQEIQVKYCLVQFGAGLADGH